VGVLPAFSFVFCSVWVFAEMAGQRKKFILLERLLHPIISAYLVWIRRDFARAVTSRCILRAVHSIGVRSGSVLDVVRLAKARHSRRFLYLPDSAD
jgi:hypothetical protein